ncbi:hypothetical protein OUZ56_013772 [Daphnia magna]|uniref:Angiotensin-converting enzyme n=1 Tax=Daphnia magna TaxID=35525 RepID=A0ABQ9Z6W6_9CRUS|nr:hypothetical protein OUZ56_013772 [Daphnia magna]
MSGFSTTSFFVCSPKEEVVMDWTASLRRPSFLLLVTILVIATAANAELNTNEDEATLFLEQLDPTYLREANAQMTTRWQYMTDITDEHAQAQVDANVKYLAFQKEAWNNVTKFDYSGFNDVTVKREFQYLNIIGPGALEEEDARRYTELSEEMETIYSEAKVCKKDDPAVCMPLEPDLTVIMATSTDYNELEYVWTKWREAAGKPIRKQYLEFVALNNKAANLNGYDDMGSLWNEYYLYEDFTEDEFKAEIEALWQTVKPLYVHLYTYVRRILSTTIYQGQVDRYGRLPAHVLGNMWAQSWGNIAKHVIPYPDAPSVDATPEMNNQGYTAKKMFELSEKFFYDLGFDNMTSTFWEKSMIEKPSDREVVCHASAEEFFFGPGTDTNFREDWRIKMCTTVTQEDFVTVHHEMGHIQYFMNYRNQHWVFRNGANPGFHEAIGDTIALAVSTPAHLKKLGLLKETTPAKTKPRIDNLPELPPGVSEQDLNYLLSQALEKIAFIPFGYLMDKWRWSVFDGSTTDSNLNAEWWRLREELQGLKPPVFRNESDFDPGAKYHIPANVEYIRYFVSYIVQFQFYESLCKEAGQYDPNNPELPLYKCDFDGSKPAGAKLKAMLEPGFSKPWPEALQALTGNAMMDATSLITYFEPLQKWLEEANSKSGECLGWEGYCESFAAEYMAGEYEDKTSYLYNQATIAEWNYQTNLTEANGVNSTEWSVKVANYRKESWEQYITQFEYELFVDDSLARQFELLQTLGVAALPEEDLTNRTNVINNMNNQYSSAKICPYQQPSCSDEEKLALEPDIEEILATSTDYDELDYVWSEWRKVASRPMLHDYEQYVELSNEAAQANGKTDMSVLWKEPYETEDFQQQLENILAETKPLFEKLHAFTRMKLRERYGEEKIPKNKSPIPASVLGNMWAQTWESLYGLLEPYPKAGTVDVTEEMQNQKWNATYMFTTAEEFYTSLGLLAMPTCYGPNSMIEKPTDGREVVCHASAWDFSDGKDFRIKMCTGIDMGDLITVHHEQGHIQYDQQYKDLPVTFRDGANPGFHEAIGDVMALSVATPKHLSKIGLIKNYTVSPESDLNFLMKTALEKITFLPFAYVMDNWRWDVFQGKYNSSNWMDRWMYLSEYYQGIVPPSIRYQDDFDPGAKYHIAADVEYSRYFVANVLQFQIHKALCLEAKEFDPKDPEKPLYRCDIYQNKDAGKIMETLLKAGLSKPWRETLNETIGASELDPSAILDYFAPLDKYLGDELTKAKELIGWNSTYKNFYRDGERYPVGDNTVPIIVGSILGALVVIVIVAYFIGRSRNNKRHKELHGHDNPTAVALG